MYKAALAAVALSLLIVVAGCMEMQEDRTGNLQSVGLPGVPIWKASKPEVTPQTQQLESAQTAHSDWLTRLNQWRQLAGVRPVGENFNLSNGCRQHAQYLVDQIPPGLNDPGAFGLMIGGEAHHESPGRQGYTDEGAQAATGGRHVQGVLQAADVSWDQPEGSGDIDELFIVPFHRLSLLAPWAKVAGFGRAGTPPKTAAALALRGPEADAASATAVSFPSPSSTLPVAAMTYSEWPNPLTSCPGYLLPVGFPITLQLGEGRAAALQSASFADETDNKPLESCAFDAVTYRNPDPGQRAAAVHSLHTFGAVVLIPRQPLQNGHSYRVTMNINGASDSWTFSVQTQQTAPIRTTASAP